MRNCARHKYCVLMKSCCSDARNNGAESSMVKSTGAFLTLRTCRSFLVREILLTIHGNLFNPSRFLLLCLLCAMILKKFFSRNLIVIIIRYVLAHQQDSFSFRIHHLAKGFFALHILINHQFSHPIVSLFLSLMICKFQLTCSHHNDFFMCVKRGINIKITESLADSLKKRPCPHPRAVSAPMAVINQRREYILSIHHVLSF